MKKFAEKICKIPNTVNHSECFTVFIPVQELDNDSLESLMVLTRQLRVDDAQVRDEVCELLTTLVPQRFPTFSAMKTWKAVRL